MPALVIRFTRLSNDRHRLVVERDTGGRVDREVETHSLLLHDLVHYALEAEAELADGFWGLLAAGMPFEELLRADAMARHPGIARAESLVGPLQAVWHGRLDAARYVDLARAAAPFVDGAFVDRALERLRRLWGRWQGTPFHDTMVLPWPAPPVTAAETSASPRHRAR